MHQNDMTKIPDKIPTGTCIGGRKATQEEHEAAMAAVFNVPQFVEVLKRMKDR